MKIANWTDPFSNVTPENGYFFNKTVKKKN